jgi:excinuclease UvrABC nuclease subunit
MVPSPAEMGIFPGQPTIRFDTVSVALTPAEPAVYAICRADGTYIFFGESKDLRRRLMEHLVDTESRIHREGAAFFAYELHSSPGGRLARRNQLIAAYPTVCN